VQRSVRLVISSYLWETVCINEGDKDLEASLYMRLRSDAATSDVHTCNLEGKAGFLANHSGGDRVTIVRASSLTTPTVAT
jgi:hypothetical protein